ncbi:hypothetical protein AKJ09_01433 [Labilithrix luteola]|uniref:Uncharacterized protein n=1 Tax=Labilithrix luteola TaxID=1391654 RepID=A0A0K1PNU1_9BACT|nr:hypothetical protein [Labilithrix luteola]AKU94769.1 hypothetical protein AKJ09_01433 [Labilithrix luteola]
MTASPSFSIEALSTSGQLVASATLREDVPVAAGWQGDVVVNAPGMLPRHVVFVASGGKVRAALVDARAPAFVGNLSLSTSWTELVAPCDVRFAGCIARLRAQEAPTSQPGQTSRSMPAPAAAEGSNKGAIIITALAFLVLLPAVIFIGVEAAKAREQTSTLAEAQVPPSPPPTASTTPTAPRKFQRKSATASESPTRPQANDAAAERRVAEALFAGDNVGALQEAETMRSNNPGVPEYRVVVRVLRAKVRRGR